jgi:hypothetical protein
MTFHETLPVDCKNFTCCPDRKKMKTIYLILMILGLIFGGLSIIFGFAFLWTLCIPSYFHQLTIMVEGGVPDFGACGQ